MRFLCAVDVHYWCCHMIRKKTMIQHRSGADFAHTSFKQNLRFFTTKLRTFLCSIGFLFWILISFKLSISHEKPLTAHPIFFRSIGVDCQLLFAQCVKEKTISCCRTHTHTLAPPKTPFAMENNVYICVVCIDGMIHIWKRWMNRRVYVCVVCAAEQGQLYGWIDDGNSNSTNSNSNNNMHTSYTLSTTTPGIIIQQRERENPKW